MSGSVKRPATYADIEAAPEHLVAEIIGGELMTHPRPSPRHGTAATSLADELTGPFQKSRGGPGGWVFVLEPEVKFGDDLLVPDIAGWHRDRLSGYPKRNFFENAPDWVCEVLSGSTEKRDRTLKSRIYALAGVPHFWLIDPRLQIMEAFENVGGRWTKIADWNSADLVRAPPFDAISFSLADLWPLDKPLGFHESPQALYAGDR
jgi:Uma2 family endonuclease